MYNSTRLLLAAACLLPVACSPGGQAPAYNQSNADVAATPGSVASGTINGGGFEAIDSTAPLKVATAAETKATGCPIVADGAWRAGIATTIDGEKFLGVIGTVVTATGGYDVKLVPGALDKMSPPTQHFTLEIRDPDPTKKVIQMKVAHPVSATAPGQSEYTAVVIDCRGEEIERITNIEH
jgi:hypothetical protein